MIAGLLWRIILGEVAVLLALLVILIVLLIWLLLRKLVVVPDISVATDKSSYFREESVQISGTLTSNGNPLIGQTVGLAIEPPTGDAYSLPSVVTDADGKFTASWQVPADAVGGSYTLTVASVGVSGTTTFTLRSNLKLSSSAKAFTPRDVLKIEMDPDELVIVCRGLVDVAIEADKENSRVLLRLLQLLLYGEWD